MRTERRFAGALVVAATAVVVAGCRQDMHDAPRYEVYEASSSFADGRSSRNAPVGTVARGQLRDDEHLYTGKVNGAPADAFPFAIGPGELARGRERYNIYCTPCHGLLGDGQGMVVQRGLRQAASYHQERLQRAQPGYFFDVITNGFGAMQGYAEQIPPRDRWMVAAYVRALQLSQNATVDDVPAADRSRLGEPASPAPAPRAER